MSESCGKIEQLLTPGRIVTVYYEFPNSGRGLAVNVEVPRLSECHTLAGAWPSLAARWAERTAGMCLMFARPELELDLSSDVAPAWVVPRALSSDLLASAIIRDADRPLLPGMAAIAWAERGMLGIRIH